MLEGVEREQLIDVPWVTFACLGAPLEPLVQHLFIARATDLQ
jgi:hypothetical protein